MVSTVWSVYCWLFFCPRYTSCPAVRKSGGTCPPALWSRSHCLSQLKSLNSSVNSVREGGGASKVLWSGATPGSTLATSPSHRFTNPFRTARFVHNCKLTNHEHEHDYNNNLWRISCCSHKAGLAHTGWPKK